METDVCAVDGDAKESREHVRVAAAEKFAPEGAATPEHIITHSKNALLQVVAGFSPSGLVRVLFLSLILRTVLLFNAHGAAA